MTHSFSFEQELGSGAMGTIYEAHAAETGEHVAVKVLHQHLANDEDICSRFDREARAAARLNHPNCVKIESYGLLDDGRRFIAMEFVDGENLEQVLKANGPLAAKEVIRAGIEIAEALHAAHVQDVIHRDLKPANILLERGDLSQMRLRVCDFGIAKILNSSTNSYQTMSGMVCGTPDYISPEQARGLPLDGRSDLYSLGILMFELLTGRPPFSGKNALELMNQHIRIEAPSIRKKRPEIPESLDTFILGLLSKKPKDRPTDASEVVETLKSMLDGTPVKTAFKGNDTFDSGGITGIQNFALDETLEQQRPSTTEVNIMQAAGRNEPMLENLREEESGLPLSVLMVLVIVGTCIAYAAISLLFFP